MEEIRISNGIVIARVPDHCRAILSIEWEDSTKVELYSEAIQAIRFTDDAVIFTQEYFDRYSSTTDAVRISVPKTKRVIKISFTFQAGGNGLIKGCCVAGIAKEGMTSEVFLRSTAYFNAQNAVDKLADLLNAHILKEGLTAKPAVAA